MARLGGGGEMVRGGGGARQLSVRIAHENAHGARWQNEAGKEGVAHCLPCHVLLLRAKAVANFGMLQKILYIYSTEF